MKAGVDPFVGEHVVYLVTASRGSYSDAEFWVVTWRTTREEAERDRARLEREAAALAEWDRERRTTEPDAWGHHGRGKPKTQREHADRISEHNRWVAEGLVMLAEIVKDFLWQPTFMHGDLPTFSVHPCSDAKAWCHPPDNEWEAEIKR